MVTYFIVVISDWKRCCYTICGRMGLDVPNKVVGEFYVVKLHASLVDL